MTRAKHGNYDEIRGLPDNRMQATGSGLDVWLQMQIYRIVGAAEGWTLEQMTERGHSELASQYDALKRGHAAKRRLADKERLLAGLQAQLAGEVNEARRAYLRKEIAKCEAYIAARTAQ